MVARWRVWSLRQEIRRPLATKPPLSRHPVPIPVQARPVEDLKITSVALDVPAELREQMARWPFKPRAPGTELARTLVHGLAAHAEGVAPGGVAFGLHDKGGALRGHGGLQPSR